VNDTFHPARGLSSPHAQTVFAAVARVPSFPKALHRERWETPDKDFFDVDLLDAKTPGAPQVLLLHGLEGSSASGYIRECLRLCAARGWAAAALNFRGCSGEPNRAARSYCSGDYDDALHVLSKLNGGGPRFAIGFSLGGNVLLKMLAEQHEKARVDAAVAVSVPFNLEECARALDTKTRWMRFYQWRFMRTLTEKSLEKASKFPQLLDAQRIRAAHSIYAFDDCVTAPLYGLESASAYYTWASSGTKVHAIRTPTLLITAEDDPLAPAKWLPPVQNPALHRSVTPFGGHVGFVSGSVFKPTFWAEAQAFDFLSQRS
jgi:predicted alpha/beta-fold hydrolase